MFTTLVDAEMLMDDDGSAIVVHENPDDHVTQPIGGAGGRVACGVLSRRVIARVPIADGRARSWLTYGSTGRWRW